MRFKSQVQLLKVVLSKVVLLKAVSSWCNGGGRQPYSLRKAGTKQTQLVNMAPLMASSSGRMTKTISASPSVCRLSMMTTNKKSPKGGFLQDLKKHILRERRSVPSSGTVKASRRHQVQATRSSGGKFTTNCLSLPAHNKSTL